MPRQANVSTMSLGAWNKKIALQRDKVGALNRDPLDITKDQIRQLYAILYPFVAADFVHRTANERFEEKVLDEVKQIIKQFNTDVKRWVATELNMHQHIGNNGAPVSPPTAVKNIGDLPELKAWESLPENGNFMDGEDHIVDANKGVPAKNIRHRDTKGNDKVKTKYPINKQLSGGPILTPFDINDKSILESKEKFGDTL